MKQIIIIGCPGSGKTYFAKQLSEILQIELFHMDNIYWKKDKTHISRGELISAVDRIISQSEWILDGNYISTIEQRIKGADTIFLFDYTTKDCLEGVKSRIGVKRDDIPWIETKLDPDFQKWIMDFRKDTLPQIEKILERYKYKKIIRFACRKDKEKYLMKLKKNVNKNITIHTTELNIELQDDQWQMEYIDHNRNIARAIVYDEDGNFYFVRAERNDDFGQATIIETAGGGVEEGEELQDAIKRELKEELGVKVDVICKIGVVSDYYNLIHRHNINNYFLCKVEFFGEKELTEDERNNISKVVKPEKKGAKYAKLDYEVLGYKPDKDLSLVKVNLHTGRHHQIRLQMANFGHSIFGDQKYGTRGKGKQIALWAYNLEFEHPITKEKMQFSVYPENNGTWKWNINI